MDLSTFTPEQIAELKQALLAGADGRSPFLKRQLDDLRLLPTANDPRPTFFWSAEAPRHQGDLTRTKPYPRLMWHRKTGHEIAVADETSQTGKEREGYVLVAPANAEAPDLAESIRMQLEQLSPEDRKTLIEAARADKLAKVREAMAGLSDTELAALVATVEPKRKTA